MATSPIDNINFRSRKDGEEGKFDGNKGKTWNSMDFNIKLVETSGPMVKSKLKI